MHLKKVLILMFAIAVASPGCKKAGESGDEKSDKADKGDKKDAEKKDTDEKSDGGDADKQPAGEAEAVKPEGGEEAAASEFYVDPGAEAPVAVTHAVAVMHPTKGNKTSGWVKFEAAEKGLKVTAEVNELPKGKHAYHVHVLGDCSGEDGKSAGTHFHFAGSSKHPPEDIKIITGDLGNLEAGKDGVAKAEVMIEGASLQGRYSILGRAIIVHEKPNDPNSPPIGAAGGRLACGVIGLTEAPAAE